MGLFEGELVGISVDDVDGDLDGALDVVSIPNIDVDGGAVLKETVAISSQPSSPIH